MTLKRKSILPIGNSIFKTDIEAIYETIKFQWAYLKLKRTTSEHAMKRHDYCQPNNPFKIYESTNGLLPTETPMQEISQDMFFAFYGSIFIHSTKKDGGSDITLTDMANKILNIAFTNNIILKDFIMGLYPNCFKKVKW